jgi:Domain of unknown function (DUF1844)
MPPEKQDDAKPSGFKVSDRRSFSESGEPASPAIPSAAAPTPDSTARSAQPAATASNQSATRSAITERELPVVDFHTFILSLGSSALLHLGELDQPDGAESHPDLPLAKHTIDIIAMLEAKTKGNLSPPEERLMESLLYDLRLRFVERSKSQPGG